MSTAIRGKALVLAGITLAAAWAMGSAAEPSAGSEVMPAHLAALRLQGPVLISGETGWPLEQRMRELDVPGVSVASCADGKVRWAEAWGFADRAGQAAVTADTLFQAASISKPVSAAAVLHQVAEGTLALDRNVNEYLRSWKLPDNELTAKEPVTLERILSHTAGLTVHGFPGYAPGEPLPTVPQILDGTPPANTGAVRVDTLPGSQFRYSGGGTTLAQLLLMDATGETFPALMSKTVLQPAGMVSSTFEQPLPPEKLSRAAVGYRRDGSPVAGQRHTYPEMAPAGLWTTPTDLCRFAMAIQDGLRGDDGALLPRSLAERMTTEFNGPAGLGFFIDRRGDEVYFGHGGANEGFRAVLTASRDHRFAVAVMTNSDNGGQLMEEVVRAVAQRERWPSFLPEPLPVVPFAEGELATLVGRYRVHGDEAFELLEEDGQLISRSAAAGSAPMFQVATDELARTDRETRYRIERQDGRVETIVVVQPARGDEPEQQRKATHMSEGESLPSDWLAAGELAKAADAYQRLHAQNPEDPGIAEGRLNVLGYQLAGEGEFAQALAVLEVAVRLYPTSANARDSLAENVLASGDRKRALTLYREVLEVLPQDPSENEEMKNFLRTNARSKIEELEAAE